MRARPDRILDHREFPVLYVDDEIENLRIFDLTFRREFSIVTARSGEEGLQVIHEQPVALVLSDHRMPGMTGVEFLSRSREIDPKTVRILVTAYGDAATLGSAINNGSIYRLVPKPWTPEEMRLTLRRGVEVYALDREREQLLRELTLLNRVSRSISQELDLEPLLDLLLETVIDELGYDAAGLLFFDPRGESLSWGRLAPREGSLGQHRVQVRITEPEAPGFLRRLRHGEAQLLSLAEAPGLEGVVRRWVTEVAAEEILVVPLMGRQGSLGALVVDNRRGGRRFDSDDQTLLEGLANQAVIAIENARLVDDLRRSREQILRADRLGTLGTLAAGLAHEIDDPLASIQTFLSMAPGKRRQDDPEFWTDRHARAAGAVDHIRRLVDAMRRLGRDSGGRAPRQVVDPSELAREVVALLQREAQRARVALRLVCDPDTPKIAAVRDQIHQVLLNLLLGAISTAPEGREVRMRVGPDPNREHLCIEVFSVKEEGATFRVRLPLGSELGQGGADSGPLLDRSTPDC